MDRLLLGERPLSLHGRQFDEIGPQVIQGKFDSPGPGRLDNLPGHGRGRAPDPPVDLADIVRVAPDGFGKLHRKFHVFDD